MKKINFILFIISIIGVILAFSLFFKEGYAININSKNRDLVSNALNGKIENLDDIALISIGVSSIIILYLLIYRYVNKNKS